MSREQRSGSPRFSYYFDGCRPPISLMLSVSAHREGRRLRYRNGVTEDRKVKHVTTAQTPADVAQVDPESPAYLLALPTGVTARECMSSRVYLSAAQ